MSIASELNKSIADLAASYAKTVVAGAEQPTLKNFDNLPATIASIDAAEVSGVPPLEIPSVSDYPARDYKIYGESVQKTYSGKNLLPNNNIDRTINGITFTHNEDGSISINGTATAQVIYPINVNSVSNSTTVPLDGGTEYELSGAIGGSSSTYYIQTYYNDGGYVYKSDRGSGVLFAPSHNVKAAMCVVVPSGATVNATIYPMLRKASVGDDSYEPYVGGIPAPNPDYPQEVESVGDSPNLAKVRPGTYSGYGVTIDIAEDGTMTINGTVSGATWFNATKGEFLHTTPTTTNKPDWFNGPFAEDGTYTIAYYGSQIERGGAYIYYNGSNNNMGVHSSRKIRTAAITRPSLQLLYYLGSSGAYNDFKIRVQFEKNNFPTPYVPYGKYGIPVTVGGKNLFDPRADDMIVGRYLDSNNVTYASEAWVTTGYIRVTPGAAYTISGVTNTGTNPSYCFYDADKAYVSGVKHNSYTGSRTFTVPEGCYFMRDAINKADLDTYQLEKGPVATAYDPYRRPETTNIILDEPLRRIGNYADYIDFRSQKVVREVISNTYDGTEDWQVYRTGTEHYYYQLNTAYGGVANISSMSNKYRYTSGIGSNDTADGFAVTSSGQLRIRYGAEVSLADFKASLQFRPLNIVQAIEPQETPISLPLLQRFAGKTVTVSVGTKIQPSDMFVKF